MSRLLTSSVENVEWSRYLREVAEKEKYNSAVVLKLTSELEASEQLKDTDVIITYLSIYYYLSLIPAIYFWTRKRVPKRYQRCSSCCCQIIHPLRLCHFLVDRSETFHTY